MRSDFEKWREDIWGRLLIVRRDVSSELRGIFWWWFNRMWINRISGDWLKNEVLECLDVLIKCVFNTKLNICDKRPSNVSGFKKLLECSNQDHDSLFMLHESRKVYLSFDTVHLIKNVRNNLLNHKRFLFLSFTFNGFKDSINVTGGELKWKMPPDVFERDAQLDGKLKKAPKLTLKVLHPGSSKQNVPLELAIFD